MNFGFAYWAFQGDYRPGSFPDGGSTAMWPILRSFQEQGWNTYLMYQDRDAELYQQMGERLFTGACAIAVTAKRAATITTRNFFMLKSS